MKLTVSLQATKIFICLCLIIITLAAYSQTRRYAMVYLDEQEAATLFHDGLTLNNIKTAFIDSTRFRQMWLPVSFLACMLGSELFEDDPGPKHLINLFLHAGSTLLLFLCFSGMTGAVWTSALLAALFAAHPVNVESVAWLAHHDSALNLFFLTLSLYFYIIYARTGSIRTYLPVLLFYLLALLSNARIMAFPLLLILLDVWPLARLRPERRERPEHARRPFPGVPLTGLRIKEKLPLLMAGFIYGAVMTVVKILQADGPPAAVNPLDTLVSYVAYIQRLLLLPGVEYNRFMKPFHPSLAHILISAAGLIAISYGVCRLTTRERLYPVVGWLWFLLALAPGVLVNAGKHVMITDRYAYLGAIGIFIMAAFGTRELFSGTRLKRITAVIVSAVLVSALTCGARNQAGHWQSSLSLLEHTMTIAPERVSHQKAGDILQAGNRLDEAILHYRLALRETPENDSLHTDIGVAYMKKGQIQKAIDHFQQSIALQPDKAIALHNLGNACLELGETARAIGYFQKSLEINPAAYQTYNSLATALAEEGRIAEAVACLKESIRINPRYETARRNLRQLTAPEINPDKR